MALSLSGTATISRDGKTITFEETTGAYALDNTGGYGAPNPLVGAFTSAVLTVTDPAGTVTPYNIFASGFPSDANNTYDIVSTTPFVDGIYTFLYEISDGVGGDYDVTFQVGFYYNITVCIYKKICKLPLPDCNCGCTQTALDHTSDMLVYFEKLKIEAWRGRVTEFNDTLELLQTMCDYESCNC